VMVLPATTHNCGWLFVVFAHSCQLILK
jgi:hypothetical protein